LFKKEMHKCLSAIWVTWCWLIWKERNHIVFARKKLSIELVLDKLKILVWCYLKFKKKNYYDLNLLRFNPSTCLWVGSYDLVFCFNKLFTIQTLFVIRLVLVLKKIV
jgi:hypothetical protein